MNRTALLVAASLAALPLLSAQEDKAKTAPPAGQAMPDQKTKEHDLLKGFVGNWDVTCSGEMPGEAKPGESKGSERAELICKGLWLKSQLSGEFGGQKMQGLWLLGYDPT